MAETAAGWQAMIEIPGPEYLAAFEALLERLGGAVAASEVEGGPRWRLVAHCAEEPDRAVLAVGLAVAAAMAGIAAPELCIEPVPDIDWVAEYQRNTRPMRIGRFFVYPSHRAGDVPEDAIPILLDAGRAFGTGSHESTAGCLRALDRLAAGGAEPARALDMGCGSGILAIAMARLWPEARLLACDNDPDAVAVAAENTARNGVEARIECVAGEGFAAPRIAAARPFAVIVANILAGPLTAMATDLAAALAPGGAAVLSGLLDTQADEVAAAYAGHGVSVSDRIVLGEWTTLLLSG